MFWDCEGPLEMKVPAVGVITISDRLEFWRVTDVANDVLSSVLMRDNVEIEGEDEESVES